MTAPVVVNLTRGRLAVYVAGRRVWVGTQDEWSTARKVAEDRAALASAMAMFNLIALMAGSAVAA